MNKNILINILIFAAGGAVGFFVAKKMLEEEYAALAQEEIDSVKEFYGRTAAREKKEDNEVEKFGNPITRTSLDNNPYEQAKKNYNLAGKSVHNEYADRLEAFRQKYDMERISEMKGEGFTPFEIAKEVGIPVEDIEYIDDAVAEDEPETDAAGKTEEEMDLTKVDRTAPYIISDVEFSLEFDHHDKVSLYYYIVDGVLAEESEEMIDDVSGTVGDDTLKQLRGRNNIVWVRNEPLAIDYEIIAVNKSFSRDILGIDEEDNLTPREKYNRSKQKNRKVDENEEE